MFSVSNKGISYNIEVLRISPPLITRVWSVPYMTYLLHTIGISFTQGFNNFQINELILSSSGDTSHSDQLQTLCGKMFTKIHLRPNWCHLCVRCPLQGDPGQKSLIVLPMSHSRTVSYCLVSQTRETQTSPPTAHIETDSRGPQTI